MSQTANLQRIRLYDQQYRFVTSQANLSAFVAGIGAGKTYAGAVKAVIESNGPTLGMIVAPTYGMLRDSTLRTFQDVAGDLIINFNQSSMIIKTKGGGEILLRSADNSEHLRGPNLNWVWIDEGGLTTEMTWSICIGRLRADGAFGKLWVTTTPKGKRNWVYTKSKEMEIYRATTFDNPYTSKEWQEMLSGSYTGNFLRQELYGDFVAFEGLIYPQFDMTKHVMVKDLNRYQDFMLGLDAGYTNPAVILKVHQDHDGNYHLAEEWYERGKLQSEQVDQTVRMAMGEDPDTYVDSSASGLIADLRNRRIRARGATSRVIDGIRKIQELLASGKLTIDPSCVHTIAEFEQYQWKPDTDEPIKENDHAMDALRYVINRPVKVKQKATQRSYL